MAMVNFAVPTRLDRRVRVAIKEKGFASKAEFFRFATMHFLDRIEGEEERFDRLTDDITALVHTRYGEKKLPSAREQFTNLQ